MSFLLRPSVCQTKRWNGNEKEQVKKFRFQLCFVQTQKPPLPHNHFLFSFHLSLYFSFSPSSCHIKVKRDFSLPTEYQMLVGLRCATNKKVIFRNLLQQFVLFLMGTNPWQVGEKRQQFNLLTLCCFTLSVRGKLKSSCCVSLVWVLDDNVTAVLLFVAAVAEHVYGPWSPLRGKKNQDCFEWIEKTLEHSLVN